MAEKPDTRKLVNPIADRGEPEVYVDIAGVEHSRPVSGDSATWDIAQNDTRNDAQNVPEERRVDKEGSEPPPKDLPMELDGI